MTAMRAEPHAGHTSLHLVVLGLSLSSSWGNGHATTYRALLKAFAQRGHRVTFLERDVAWYQGKNRDFPHPDFCDLVFYADLPALDHHATLVAAADVVMVGSYVPQGVQVGTWVQAVARGPVVFYDIDTPVTLAKLLSGVGEYLSEELIPGYDIYFSFTGGPTLEVLEHSYGTPAARALYCSVDPVAYQPRDVPARWDLSYLGTYSADRQPTLESLLIETARRAPARHFAVAGPQYPANIDWPSNIERIEHVPPAQHPDFYAASRYTLNVTRADMIATGWSPSVRLFEAAACGTPIISDIWDGIETLLDPRTAIRLADSTEAVLSILAQPEGIRRSIATAARQSILASHTAFHRAAELEAELRNAICRRCTKPA